MDCPICGTPTNESDIECQCGELLTDWRVLQQNGEILRQRGLVLAQKGDFAMACLAFVESALTDPFHTVSLIDAAKALLRLKRVDHALRFLSYAEKRSKKSGAAEISEAIHALIVRQQEQKEAATPECETAGHNSTASDTTASHQPALGHESGQLPLLGLAPIPRTRRKFGFLRKREPTSPIWMVVLKIEQNWDGDWGLLAPSLAQVHKAMAPSDNGGDVAVFNYMSGLVRWQAGKLKKAKTYFQKCVKQRPNVMNPVAYCLYLSAVDTSKIHETWDFFRKHCHPSDINRVKDALTERLDSEADEQSQKVVRWLKSFQ